MQNSAADEQFEAANYTKNFEAEPLGSARVSRAGRWRLAIANFLKDCFGETPKPTRETRTLPRFLVPSH